MTLIKLFFSPRGRIPPQTFWIGFAILSVVSIGCLFVPRVGGWLWLATLFPWIMLTAKRLHDMGLSGWMQLAIVAFNAGIAGAALVMLGTAVFLTLFKDNPVQATLEAGAAAGVAGGFLITGGLVVVNTLWLIWLGGSPSAPDENRFGRPPGWPDEEMETDA